MHISSATLANTQRTIDSYEGCADEYSRIVDPFPSPSLEAALRQVATAAGKGGQILEIGSGAGWDADFLETQGVSVRRTDATRRFLELQAARGKEGELLNVITDDLGGPYDAVVALCVLIRKDRRCATPGRRLPGVDAGWGWRDERRLPYVLLAPGRLRGVHPEGGPGS